jgi:CheY-like chemotaxis protein
VRARIALIDDDPDFTGLILELLAEYGWDAVACNDDCTAVDCVRDEQPDLVILDVRMRTRESGWQILDRLADDPDLRAIPIIICTAALDDLKARQDWLDERHIATLAKPFDIDDLLRRLDRAVQPGLAGARERSQEAAPHE